MSNCNLSAKPRKDGMLKIQVQWWQREQLENVTYFVVSFILNTEKVKFFGFTGERWIETKKRGGLTWSAAGFASVECVNFHNHKSWSGRRRATATTTLTATEGNMDEQRHREGYWLSAESGGTDDSAKRQIRHSKTPWSQSITATTQLSLNVTLWLHCELAAEWSRSDEAEQRPRERERKRGRERGRKRENERSERRTRKKLPEWHTLGQNWPEKRKGELLRRWRTFLKRGRGMKNSDDLKIGTEKRRGDLLAHSPLSDRGSLFLFDST